MLVTGAKIRIAKPSYKTKDKKIKLILLGKWQENEFIYCQKKIYSF